MPFYVVIPPPGIPLTRDLASWPPFARFFQALQTQLSTPFRNRKYRAAIRQLVKDPWGRSPFHESPVITAKEEKQPQTSSLNEVGEPGTSRTHEENTEREAYNQRRSRAESKVPKIVKIAWQENDSGKTGPD